MLVCSAVTLLGIVHLAGQLSEESSPAPQPQARGIVWGGRTFVDLATFARWLRSRGFSYAVWAERHPVRSGIAALLPPPSRSARTPKAGGGGGGSAWLRWGLVGSAAVLALFAVAVGIRRRDRLLQASNELLTMQLVVAARRGAVAAALGARRIVRLAREFPAAQLADAARRSAAAGGIGGRLLLRLAVRLVIVSARLALEGIVSGSRIAWHRRDELAWYVAAAMFAAVSALALTVWA